MAEGTKTFASAVDEFNQSLEKNDIGGVTLDDAEDGLAGRSDNLIDLDLDLGRNEEVNELFLAAQESLSVTTDLADFNL